MFDLRFDFLKLRHLGIARLVRRSIFTSLVGQSEWPLVFRRPAPEADFNADVSPNLYVHIPFCRSICPHCPYNKQLYKSDLADRYATALLAEIRDYLARPSAVPVRSLHFGGGTPSLMVDLIGAAIDTCRDHLTPEAEIGVEVHPADATPELLAELRNHGVNQISLGIETLDAALLKRFARRYSPDEALDALRNAKAAGFACVDVNLIYGLPDQTPESAVRDAETCLSHGADQISAYPLMTFVHTKVGEQTRNGRFPIYSDWHRLRAQKGISRACLAGGLKRTSVWSFTRPEVPTYTTVTRGCYRGFGAGAGSKIGGKFWFNTFSVDAYANANAQRPALAMSASAKLERVHWLYWRIYCARIAPSEYERQFGRNLEADFPWLMRALRLLRWIKWADGAWHLSEAGAIWVHRVQCLFSLTYIDEVWTLCQSEAWPEQAVLDA